jgi:hypothetical protein
MPPPVKSKDVTQDDSFLEGHQKAAYAVDENGQYVVVPSRGYADEVVATSFALVQQDKRIQAAWERAKKGEVSPLAYHLAVKQWTLPLAAAQMGLWRIFVWWHCQPRGFAGMSESLRQKYSAELDVPLEQLARVPEKPELTLG